MGIGGGLNDPAVADRYRLAIRNVPDRIFDPLAGIEAGTRGHIWRPLEKGTISGMVFTPDGKPLAGVYMVAVPTSQLDAQAVPPPAPNFPGWLGRSCTSGAEGRFAITLLDRDDYVLIAADMNHAPTLRRGLGWMSKGVRMKLLPGHTLRGRVLDDKGDPSAAQVTVRDRWGMKRSVGTRTGAFTVTGLAAGECEVVAEHEGRTARASRVPTTTTDLELRLVSNPPK